ncbi:ankyrin, partial [Trematosphaeria pertusa]
MRQEAENASAEDTDDGRSTQTKWVALHFAAQEGSLPMTRSLLRHGAQVNAKEDEGLTPLHIAANGGYINVVSELLSHRAEPNAEDFSGRTPLFPAANKRHLTVAREL